MGLATANAFAESGAAVVLVDVNEAAVRAAAEQLVVAGHKAIAVPCDVAHDEQGKRLVEQTVSTLCVRIWRGVSLSGAKSLGREVLVLYQKRPRTRLRSLVGSAAVAFDTTT